MRNVKSEEQLAKAAYNWLKVSPVVTITTLFFINGFDIGYSLCNNDFFACGYQTSAAINLGIGVLVSALWHLTLLQYINNKDSEFVRKHGKQALIYAGIRTGVAFAGVILDFFAGANGALACATVIILIVLWAAQTNAGLEKIKKELEANPNILRENIQQGKTTSADISSNEVIDTKNERAEEKEETPMETNSTQNNQSQQEILDSALAGLRSNTDSDRMQAIETLRGINFSSPAIRVLLEKMSLQDSNSVVQKEAFKLLSSPANQAVQKHLIANKLDRGVRYSILQEINGWEKDGLIENQNAEVIRHRYNFDFASTPQTQAVPVSKPVVASQPAQPASPQKPVEPEGPRPSLLQTLTSEAAIKIYLYLGAFFVISAATFIGVVIPELLLPILMIGTLIFGGLALGIKKRLPQPSFALFIVFSFLLLITAGDLEQTLRDTFNYEAFVTSMYWAVVLFILSAIWVGGTKLYNSRLFSLTAFGSFTLALLNIADAFDTEPEIYTIAASLASFVGLAGVSLLKKWRDKNFALPLFLSTQLVQGIVLVVSISIFGVKIVDPINVPIWHLIPFFVWALACVFIILSDRQYSNFAYPWLAAGVLIPLPWFIAAAFDIESLGSTIILFVWGAVLSIASELLNKKESIRRYSLPLLIASIPAFGLSLITAFTYENWLGLVISLGIAVIFTVLHILRTRWWLWTLALLNFVVAYFAFLNLNFLENLDIPLAFAWLALSILLLLPDLFLKKDWKDNPQWRLPLRIYGAFFAFLTIIFAPFTPLVPQIIKINVATIFAIYTIFFAVYAIAYKNSWLGYLSTAALPVAIAYALAHFNIDAWLPALTFVSILYFVFGIVLREKENWSFMLRNSSLILGSIISLVALFTFKETGGWYALVIGLLFITEMYLRRNGFFEIGVPILFSIGAFLILRDFNVDRISYQLLTYSLVWILTDLLTHLTFKHPRPLSLMIRGIGGFITAVNFGFLFVETNANATTGFGVYTLLFLTVSLLYKNSTLLYAFTLTLPIVVTFLFRIFDFTKWIHPAIVIAIVYYGAGFLLRARERAKGWDLTLLYSGLGLGIIVSLVSPVLGGLDAVIPVAVAATLWAVEAFLKRNAWLAFPANGLYLLAYFILLNELSVNQTQFYSIGAALLGLIQHYLLSRAKSKAGAFIMGMISQFVLLGTTYSQMLSEGELVYFFVLFVQSMVVLVYGIIIRSRSLTFFPIGFVVLGVMTVVLGQLQELGTILVIGCAGVLLLTLGILAVLLRERIAKLGERISDWQA